MKVHDPDGMALPDNSGRPQFAELRFEIIISGHEPITYSIDLLTHPSMFQCQQDLRKFLEDELEIGPQHWEGRRRPPVFSVKDAE